MALEGPEFAVGLDPRGAGLAGAPMVGLVPEGVAIRVDHRRRPRDPDDAASASRRWSTS
jgi:hypothetical protein